MEGLDRVGCAFVHVSVCLPRESERGASAVCLCGFVGSCLLSLVLKVDYSSPLKRKG